METERDAAETCTNELRGRRLNGAGIGHRCRRTGIFDSSKRAIDKGDAAGGVVDTDIEFAPASTAHDVRLDLLVVVDVASLQCDFTERSNKLEKVANLDGVVNLRELREEAGEKGVLQEGDVGRIQTVGCERFEKRRNGRAERKRVEGDFEHVVQGLDGCRREFQDIPGELMTRVSAFQR